MDKKIVFICPYFGTLPEYFPLWLKSCKKNHTIDWIIITDDKASYEYPENVRVYYCSFRKFAAYIRKKTGFASSIKYPYKLCDYKPVYGKIMEDQIRGYDFWGHCDMDTVFGDLRKFFTEEILCSCDKLMFLGHMTLYRNTSKVNNRYLLSAGLGRLSEEILTHSENQQFDEFSRYGINRIYQVHRFPMKRMDAMYADISPLRYAFMLSKYDENYKQYYEPFQPRVFEWIDGQLFDCTVKTSGQIRKREIGYVHFQKRKMENHVNISADRFYIIPSGFAEADGNLTAADIQKFSKDKVFYVPFFKLKFKAFQYRLTHIGQDN